MSSFLENVDMLVIVFVIGYGYKKILGYYDSQHSGFYEDKKVYKAADKFVNGSDYDDVKVLLTSCRDFDEDDADKILSRSLPHKTDKDGGYREFIRSVNKVLGVYIYSENYHTR